MFDNASERLHEQETDGKRKLSNGVRKENTSSRTITLKIHSERQLNSIERG